ncbi:MAG: fibronectin type III domain-containing protein [Oscillospiraceae bacterium]|nr:fibronectin type III domain-containing protein [Oscillospiraceae bacterium]
MKTRKTMNVLLSVFLAFTAVICIGAFSFKAQAAEEKTSGLYKYVLLDDGTAEITRYMGYMVTNVSIPSKIDGKTVTSIGDGAFRSTGGTKEITVPDTVRKIDDRAFEYCSSLTKISLPSGLTRIGEEAFNGCSSLAKLTIPGSVTSLGNNILSSTAFSETKSNWTNNALYLGTWLISFDESSAGKFAVKDGTVGIAENIFDYCNDLTSISIPASVKYIGSSGVANNSPELKSIEVAAANKNYCSVDGVLFNKDKTLLIKYPAKKDGASYSVPSTVRTIGAFAFNGCEALTSVTIPSSVTAIQKYAFWYCSNIASLTIPQSVKSIGEGAFSCCFSLEKLTLSAEIKTLEYRTFHCCSELSTVNIPNTVTKIGAEVFSECSELKSVSIPESVSYIGEGTFESCISLTGVKLPGGLKIISNNLFNGCEALTSINFPAGLTEIGDSAFKNSGLETADIPDTVKTIGDYAFSYSSLKKVKLPNGITDIGFCTFERTAIEELTIPNTVKTIGVSAFEHCNITELTIPDSVTEIHQKAFKDIANLKKITMGDGVTKLNDMVFENCPNLTDVRLSNNLRNIPWSAFGYCESLQKIVIPDSVTEIGGNAFAGCYKLSDVTLPKNLKKLGDSAFYECKKLSSIDIPGTLTEIGQLVFYKTAISEADCPESLKSVGYNPFELTPFSKKQTDGGIYWGNWLIAWNDHIEVDENGEAISYPEDCPDNETIIIKDGTVGIAAQVFCPTSKVYGENLSYMHNAHHVDKITIPNTVKYIGFGAFSNCQFEALTIPDSVIEIGEFCFQYCDKLKTVKLSNNIKALNDYTFAYCSSLESIKIPDSVERVGVMVFYKTAMYESQKNNIVQYADNWIVAAPNIYGKDKYTVKDGTVGICENAFIGSPTGEITIPKSVKHISPHAFGYFTVGSFYNQIRYFVVKCYPDSAALDYAKSNGLTYEVICNHSYKLKSTRAATCSAAGVKTYECTICGKTYTQSVAKKSHSFKTTVTKATMEKNGKIVKKCTACGATVTTTISKVSKITLSSTKFTYNGKTLKNGTDYKLSYSKGRKYVGKYSVKITFMGNYSGSKTLYFTVVPKSVKVKDVDSGKKKMTVKWSAEKKQTTGYEIQYSTSSSFKSGNKTVKITNNKTVSKKVSGLKSGKKYYVRVRTYKTVDGKKYYSDWSKKVSVKIK